MEPGNWDPLKGARRLPRVDLSGSGRDILFQVFFFEVVRIGVLWVWLWLMGVFETRCRGCIQVLLGFGRKVFVRGVSLEVLSLGRLLVLGWPVVCRSLGYIDGRFSGCLGLGVKLLG